MFKRALLGCLIAFCALMAWPPPITLAGEAASPATRPARRRDTSRGDRLLRDYFAAETARLADRCLVDIKTVDDWNAHKQTYRQQLAEMLGLWPMPERTDLKPVITGTIDHGDFTVEKLLLQSSPGLYVTANLYLPGKHDKPLPAILYACGHSRVKDPATGASLGNKTAYQHHGEWFARNGYVCLVYDTLQLGEIEGIHHGLYREKMWWWLNRGYTPAGVEAWNGIRCLDYLQSRPEVDGERIGMTGRSGGGAYTWFVAALDERVKAAVPVAGITDLHNHVVDGCIEGHCDCMYFTNTYRWDYAQLAALISPRPLLIANSDKDAIFPLDGVYRLHQKVRRIYALQKAEKNLGLLITEGPHKDTQELQVPTFRWFNRFLKNDLEPITDVAAPLLEPASLKVLDAIPADQRNTTIQETFIPTAEPPPVPESAEAWAAQRDYWMKRLREKTFGAWPDRPPPLQLKQAFDATRDGVRFTAYDFVSQTHVPLRLYLARNDRAKQIDLIVLDEQRWPGWLASWATHFPDALAEETQIAGALPPPTDETWRRAKAAAADDEALAWIAPRGIGLTAWGGDDKAKTHLRRRFVLLGQTLDGMRVWDVRRAMAALHEIDGLGPVPVALQADGPMAGVALYAAVFEPGLSRLDLLRPPTSHRDGPYLLNVRQTFDIPAAIALVAEHTPVRIKAAPASRPAFEYPLSVARELDWNADRVHFEADKASDPASDAQ